MDRNQENAISMTVNLKISALLLILVALWNTGCKKRTDPPATDKLTVLKQQAAGEWELRTGVYIEYDETGKESYRHGLPAESPAPWYDLRQPDILYLTDRHGREGIAYKLSVSADGVSRIEIAASSYDISKTFDITMINATNMTWVHDERFKDAGPGFLSRVYTEYNFTKR